MLFKESQIEIPKRLFEKNNSIPLGMIGGIPVELQKNKLEVLVISTPHADFEVSDETPLGVIRKLEEVMRYFIDWHPELLYGRNFKR